MTNSSSNPNSPKISALGGTRDDVGESRNGDCLTSLTSTTAQHDSANELWDIYLDEVKEDDERISKAWKDDSDGILVFVSPNLLAQFVSMTSSKTGLFSATVSAFIIEFYKTLLPGSSFGHQSVALSGRLQSNLLISKTAPTPTRRINHFLPVHPWFGSIRCG